MGWNRMGDTCGSNLSGPEADDYAVRSDGDRGPRDARGKWVGGVERGMYKSPPFPVGATVGELTVLRYEPKSDRAGRARGWHPVCRCSCGWEGSVDRQNLIRGRSTRCNFCAKIKSNQKRYWKYKHACDDDATRTRLLNRLSACITRCHNPNSKQFHHYGGRGITVYGGWRADRASFLQYALTLPGHDKPELEMDRIDVDGGYEPGNIRFVTRSTNMQNRRDIRTMQERILALEAENADLRHRLSWTEK